MAITGPVVHPFEPLFGPDSRILILGSFPSVKSRESGFFYGHPQNRFWPMLAAVFEAPVPRTVSEKTDLVLRNRLALWDTLAACTITGSSDASVRDPVPTDLSRVLSRCPIERILCNGRLSWSLYARFQEKETGIPAHCMPSTSPANAAWSPERLRAAWAPLLI